MKTHWLTRTLFAAAGALLLSACMETAPRTAEAPASPPPAGASTAAPAFGNPSPTSGSSTSAKANAAADAAAYKEVAYKNAKKKGPALIVIPGDIKSNNASFTQRFLPNNIADFAELELSQANFTVLERSNLGPLINEITLAYNLGNVASARTVSYTHLTLPTKRIV